jgi:hypothetical protein
MHEEADVTEFVEAVERLCRIYPKPLPWFTREQPQRTAHTPQIRCTLDDRRDDAGEKQQAS